MLYIASRSNSELMIHHFFLARFLLQNLLLIFFLCLSSLATLPLLPFSSIKSKISLFHSIKVRENPFCPIFTLKLEKEINLFFSQNHFRTKTNKFSNNFHYSSTFFRSVSFVGGDSNARKIRNSRKKVQLEQLQQLVLQLSWKDQEFLVHREFRVNSKTEIRKE